MKPGMARSAFATKDTPDTMESVASVPPTQSINPTLISANAGKLTTQLMGHVSSVTLTANGTFQRAPAFVMTVTMATTASVPDAICLVQLVLMLGLKIAYHAMATKSLKTESALAKLLSPLQAQSL